MFNGPLCRGWNRSGRLAVATLAAFLASALLPISSARPVQAAQNSLLTMEQPSASVLQSAFQAVAAGTLPKGYPASNDGCHVPASLLKAVAWTESKWRQFVAPQQPLVSYDGGYGIMQITTGMNAGGLPETIRSAIANNYVYNLAYGAQFLVQKFISTPSIGNDDPAVLENWYYALWAYSGWGWVNNPSNPAFTRDGTPATNPAAFPYQERVYYWLANPPPGPDGTPLWTAIPVALPDPSAIGATPGPLPEAAQPHYDVPTSYPALSIPIDRGTRFVADVTVPDGTVMQPGQHFLKTWLLANTGTVTWDSTYHWTPVSGDSLGSTGSITLDTTPSLAEVDVSAYLTAPMRPGAYRETWQMFGPDDQPFGVQAWVSIVVGSMPPATDSPTDAFVTPQISNASYDSSSLATPGSSIALGSSLAQVAFQQSSDTGDDAVFNGDITIPDGTVLAPGATFVKTWRIKNIGATTWTSRYTWRFEAGTLMSSPTFVNVPSTAPGHSALISVPMTAPMATGAYTSFWQMSNAAGTTFPHQAWVNIVVRAGGSKPTPSKSGTTKPTNTATTLPISTPTPLPSSTSVPATPSASPSLSTPRVTATVAATQSTGPATGGGSQPLVAPWTGALSDRWYFPAGSTAGLMHETIAVYNPNVLATDVWLTLYRPDATQRVVEFRLVSGSYRVFALSALAPSTGVAVSVAADRRVVAERLATMQAGLLGSPGVARAANTWYFPAVPLGAPALQELALFNPQDSPAPVHVHIDTAANSCCSSDLTITVPAQSQLLYPLGTSATHRGPMTITSGAGVAAERLATDTTQANVVGIPGTVVAATHWYLPDVRGASGSEIALFNPTGRAVLATIRTALTVGSGPWLQVNVPAHSEMLVPVSQLTRTAALAAEVDGSGPLVVASEWYDGTTSPTTAIGSVATATSWSFIGGLAGKGASDSLSVFNPAYTACTVSIREGSPGSETHWTVSIPAHGRYSHPLIDPVHVTGVVTIVRSSTPIDVEHVISSPHGATVSPATNL